MRAACVCLAVVLLGSACPALAAPPGANLSGKPAAAATPADREAARRLAKRGYELFEQRDYKTAIACFQAAEEHVHAPPHWLYIARAQVKLGALVAAKEAYEHILAEKLGADASQPFKDAQDSARTELAQLEPRIPSIYITLTGVAAPKATVTLDGIKLAPEEVGQPKLCDPGPHTVVVEAPGGSQVERKVTVKEGSNVERVNITLDASSSPSIVPPVIAFSLGGLALAAGGVTLGLALTNEGLKPQDKPLVKNLKIASVVSFVGGGIGVGIGITLVALRPSRKAAKSAELRPTIEAKIGPSSIAVQGRF